MKAVIRGVVVGCLAFGWGGSAYANPAHEMLSKMSAAQRKSTLANFLVNSGENCPSVSRTFYQGSLQNGDAFWNVACNGGDSWAVQIKNDSKGSTTILSCKVLKAVGGGTCFKEFKK